jgi:hypothetical protein
LTEERERKIKEELKNDRRKGEEDEGREEKKEEGRAKE